MTHPEGGFFPPKMLTAKVKKENFIYGDEEELRNILNKEESDFAIKTFNVSENGNWVDESIGTKPGTNILHLDKSNKELAEEFNCTEEEFVNKLGNIRKKLLNLERIEFTRIKMIRS